MNIEQFVSLTEDIARPPSSRSIQSFENELGLTLPSEYRDFLGRCNGGYVGGSIWFAEEVGEVVNSKVGIQHVGGLRRDEDFSLRANRKVYQLDTHRIPDEWLWVMDDVFGNAICLGMVGAVRGKVSFWNHDAATGTSNVELLAHSFRLFLEGCVGPVD